MVRCISCCQSVVGSPTTCGCNLRFTGIRWIAAPNPALWSRGVLRRGGRSRRQRGQEEARAERWNSPHPRAGAREEEPAIEEKTHRQAAEATAQGKGGRGEKRVGTIRSFAGGNQEANWGRWECRSRR